MSETIMIASGKGGVGKSTAAAFLGKALGEKNKRVLLIDGDTGLGALDIIFGVADKVMNTWLDIELSNCSPEQAFIRISENLFLLPSPKFFPENPENVDENVFNNIIRQCKNNFDYIFVDASAGIESNLKWAVKGCEKGIFVATADEISVRGAAAAGDKAQEYGMKRENMRLLINRFSKKAAVKSRLLSIDGVIDKSGVMLLGILPEDKKIPFSSVTNVFPGKKSPFMKAVSRVCGRIEGENVPLKLNELK